MGAKVVGERAKPRQLPLELGHPTGLSREHLIVSQANAAAAGLVDRWPEWTAPVVVLAGPVGSGKSHLAAIWAEKAQAAVAAPEAIDAAAIEAAREHPVLIDGIEPGHLDETGLFHLINQVRTAGTSLLLTSRHFPLAWRAGLPDLISRLRAATLVEIGEPDDLLLAGVITKLFADRQIQIEPHVVHYLIARIERSLSTASRVVEKLDRAALEHKARITRALAAEIVSALDAGQSELDL
ncbi:DnaA regulatory inactivator HdaA [Mesorhizobium xinjiangense]|uniref:DnaA regulatory inactivator HdaA n=1 Tax=Mesorhizobium xinjiangense TaxID=2678685 RepID=UPI0012ED4153|nr:DnaA regulatory inactivator HdaA [Mesorhizobium xinjiangense]